MQKKNLFSFHFRAKVPSRFVSKVVQIERKTKGKQVFLCFSEMQPTFEVCLKGTKNSIKREQKN